MDSNRSRARAKDRKRAEQAKLLASVDSAQQQLVAAQGQLDEALIEAVDRHVHSEQLREALGGLTHATFWRRVETARERRGPRANRGLTDELTLYTASWTAVWRDSQQVGAGNEGFVPVRTSVGVPRFWPMAKQFPVAKLITPYGLRKLEGDEFRERYLARLNKAGTEKIRAELAAIHALYRKPLVLLCFEKDRADCHREQFAEWWEERTGELVLELEPAGAPRP